MSEQPAAKKAESKAAAKESEAKATEEAEVEDVGLPEGEAHALRDEAGVNALAGGAASRVEWENSDAGKAFLEDEDDRNKEAEEAAEKAHEDLDDDGLSEADKKYQEAVSSNQSVADKDADKK